MGTGGGREGGDERVKARPRIPLEKTPERPWTAARKRKCYGGVPLPLRSDLCVAQLLFQLQCLGRVTLLCISK